MEANDDDAERINAEKMQQDKAELKQQQARSPFRETPGHQRKTEQLTDMYGAWIQMANENVRPSRARAGRARPQPRGTEARARPPLRRK